ncbi:glucokinase [Fusarium oxysporum]|nr:glucokinase [Fusarium oxysporum]
MRAFTKRVPASNKSPPTSPAFPMAQKRVCIWPLIWEAQTSEFAPSCSMVTPPLTSLTTRLPFRRSLWSQRPPHNSFLSSPSRSRSSSRSTMPTASTPTCVVATLPVLPRAIAMNISSAWGFTFSFPVKQLAINKGLLIRWTKGFDIPDAIGKDVCALLQTEIDKLHLPVKVAALVNDTVGTLMARSYTSTSKSRSVLGAIFGTGTNGAYMEKLSNIKKPISGEYDQSTGEMVVNTEWGSFDNQLNVLPSTPWDKALDAESVNPGLQMFEKRVSGMFLGEIVRLAMADMINNESSSLFKDLNSSTNDWGTTTNIAPSSGFLKPWGLDSSIMSVAAADNTPELSTLRQELENLLSVYTPSLEDAQAFKSVSNAVGRRAARLSAVAIGAIALNSGKLNDLDEEVIDIGVDGSLVEHYPFFRDMIYEALRAIDGIGPQGAEKIRIGIAKDGSGVGAALIALVAAGREKPEDYLTDLRSESNRARKSSDAILDSAPVSNQALLIGGAVGLLALAAIWYSKRR